MTQRSPGPGRAAGVGAPKEQAKPEPTRIGRSPACWTESKEGHGGEAVVHLLRRGGGGAKEFRPA